MNDFLIGKCSNSNVWSGFSHLNCSCKYSWQETCLPKMTKQVTQCLKKKKKKCFVLQIKAPTAPLRLLKLTLDALPH